MLGLQELERYQAEMDRRGYKPCHPQTFRQQLPKYVLAELVNRLGINSRRLSTFPLPPLQNLGSVFEVLLEQALVWLLH